MVRTLGFCRNLLGLVLTSALMSVVITILLFPLWSWIEASTGVESVGHSGPAEWCYIAIFIIVVTSAVPAFFFGTDGSRITPLDMTFDC
jgi:hypothetical protein